VFSGQKLDASAFAVQVLEKALCLQRERRLMAHAAEERCIYMAGLCVNE
jgi:hypothetical protein